MTCLSNVKHLLQFLRIFYFFAYARFAKFLENFLHRIFFGRICYFYFYAHQLRIFYAKKVENRIFYVYAFHSLGNTTNLMYQNGRSMSFRVLELWVFLWKKSFFKFIYFNATVTFLESLLHIKYKNHSLEIYATYRETLAIEIITISKRCLLWVLS